MSLLLTIVASAGASRGVGWPPTRKIAPLGRFLLMHRSLCAPIRLRLAPYLLDSGAGTDCYPVKY